MKKIGVVSFQGSFAEHLECIRRCKAVPIAVRTVSDLSECNGLIIPGGESTTLRKILTGAGLRKAIFKRVRKGMPVWGSCAGAILLASEIEGELPFIPVAAVSVKRNAYGSQLDSFEKKISIKGFSEKFLAVFIRAPVFKNKGMSILAYVEKNPVLLLQKNVLLTSFHPELTDDLRVHKLFIGMIK
jgi:pyridoxal 5'-phosphate synthase pdxT subunit